MQYDVIIIGAGVAGLSTAAHLPSSMRVLVVSKDYPWECNTFYAQGGVAVANSHEDIGAHIADTLEAGVRYGNPEAVRILCSEGPARVEALIAQGFAFDVDEKGALLYTQEAAHSDKRIVHAGGDATGREIHLHLMRHLQTTLLYNTQVVDLLIEEGRCYGVRVRNQDGLSCVYAKHIVMASGGVGSLYEFHTNARTISADLQGIGLEHGLALKDMEMMQFHPTVYVKSKGVRKQLLSEALRGEGAKVVDASGRQFLFDYDPDGELAARDVVSQSIFDYQHTHDQDVFLDVSFLDKVAFAKRFPSIYFAMQNEGVDVPHARIPISPAFHYAMGGIATDMQGRVGGVENLYAVGEVACTGVHGANRLASNSLLEGLVFSARVAEAILQSTYTIAPKTFTCKEETLQYEGDKAKKNALRLLMWKNAGIVRTTKGMEEALNRVQDMLKCRTGKLLRLRLLASQEILRHALRRRESLGAHRLVEK
ncbi:MAG: L-aspartate oxidase [Campylobacterales bacterium]|nr:L-aspartate oxidase [Campylobacterales bacterium]